MSPVLLIGLALSTISTYDYVISFDAVLLTWDCCTVSMHIDGTWHLLYPHLLELLEPLCLLQQGLLYWVYAH